MGVYELELDCTTHLHVTLVGGRGEGWVLQFQDHRHGGMGYGIPLSRLAACRLVDELLPQLSAIERLGALHDEES